MKKLVLVAIAVLLAMPVMSYAGSPSARGWDVTIGGFAAVFGQWSDQNDIEWGAGSAAKRRTGVNENLDDRVTNLAAQLDGRLIFAVKGPDTFGAKTQGYVAFDFAGINSGENGDARIREVWLRFDWAKDSIIFGNTVVPYRINGATITTANNGGTIHALPGAFGGPRSTQLKWTHMWTKDWSSYFALVYPSQDGWKGAGTPNIYTQSDVPSLEGGIKWASDACGAIAHHKLMLSLSGVYTRKAFLRGTSTGTGYSQHAEDGWYGQASFMIPIIPQKQNNKAGALLFWMEAAAGQGLAGGFNPGTMLEAYRRPGGDYAAPRSVAYFVGLNAWFTDTVWVSAQYNSIDKHFSKWSKAAAGTGIDETTISRNQLYQIALYYQPNPAINLGLEYSRLHTNYTKDSTVGFKKWGTANSYRIGAYYLF